MSSAPRSSPLRIAYGLYALLAFVLVIAPCSLLIVAAPGLATRRFIGRKAVSLAMWAMGSPLRIKGLEHLPPGPAVCVSNHASYLDGIVLTAALPARYSFLVQHGAARWPLIGVVIRRMGVSFVNRGSAREAASATRELLRRLRAGECFTIFPEGTFEAPPGILPFNNGAFLIAARAGVPVVPAVIRGSRAFLGEGMVLPAPARVEIEFFPPCLPSGETKPAVVALREAARAVIVAHSGEPDLATAQAAETPIAEPA